MKIKKINEQNEDEVKFLDDHEWERAIKKFEKVKEKLISELNTKRLIGNTLADLGNFIGQTIYEWVDEDDSSFSSDDFISGFEHGIDSMKEPSESKWHNFEESYRNK